MKKFIFYITIPVLVLLNSDELPGMHMKDIFFHESETVGNEVLKIRGDGLLKWLFFKVYRVALYLPPDVPSEKALDNVPKIMVFHYLVNMTTEQFAQAGENFLVKNASEYELSLIKTELDAIHDMYRDVKKGERYSLSYLPGRGTELALNGEVLGLIEGYDFAAIYFRIWLGDNPVDDEMKHKLLNDAGREFSLNVTDRRK